MIGALLVLVSVTVSSLAAQPAAEVRGTVTDGDSGRPLAGVSVRLSGSATATTTDAKGRLRHPGSLGRGRARILLRGLSGPEGPDRGPDAGRRRAETRTPRNGRGEGPRHGQRHRRPLAGVTVVLSGSARGTTTDAKGAYTLRVQSAESVLDFSYLGYVSQKIRVGNRSQIDVTLTADNKDIDEVVVIGYSEVKKTDLTGSVTNVRMGDIKDIPVVSVDQALQGRGRGRHHVHVGRPDGLDFDPHPRHALDHGFERAADRRRRHHRRRAGPERHQLGRHRVDFGAQGRLVDGHLRRARLERRDHRHHEEGQSHGEQAVDHAQGRHGFFAAAPRSRRDERHGVRPLPQRRDLFQLADGQPSGQDYTYNDPYSLGRGTDWIDEITRTAPYQNYNLSVSGRSKTSSYFVSLGYSDIQGIVDDSGFQRTTARVNVSHDFAKWITAGVNSSISYRDEANNKANIGGSSVWNAATYLAPDAQPGGHLQSLLRLGPDDQQSALHDRPEREHAGAFRLDQYVICRPETR